MKTFYLLVLISIVSACKTYSDEDVSGFDKKILDYLKKNKISCEKSESGLYYKIINPGTGNLIRYQDKVSFVYEGKLLNGTTFDQQKKPVTFAVKDLIAGWKEIMLELKPGAKVFMVIPPQLGYGDHDLKDIPQNSVLIFNMEIKEVE